MGLVADRSLGSLMAGAVTLATAALATAAEEQPQRRDMTQAEIEAWLDSRGMPGSRDIGPVEEEPEAPPPPPRSRGIVIETGVGALSHLGTMKNVSPTSPWFHFKLGVEPLSWLMLFGEADVAFATTSYAARPPEPRGYAHYGVGAGLRFTLRPADWLGIYLQGSAGMAEVSEDVLFVYGYTNADSMNLYFGGALGLEWYQVSPHLALSAHAGVRSYGDGMSRLRSTDPPIAILGGASLRYAFDL